MEVEHKVEGGDWHGLEFCLEGNGTKGREERERGGKMGQGQEGASRNVRGEGDMDQFSLQGPYHQHKVSRLCKTIVLP